MNPYCTLLFNKYLAMTLWFIPSNLQHNERHARSGQNFVTLALLAVGSVPFFALLYHLLDFDKAGVIVLLGGLGMLSAPFVLKASGRIAFAREAFVCSLYCFKLSLSYYLGGIESPTMPWLLLCPMIAMTWGGTRPFLIWVAIVTITVFGVFYLQTSGVHFPVSPISDQRLLHLLSVLCLSIFSSIVIALFELNARNLRRPIRIDSSEKCDQEQGRCLDTQAAIAKTS